MFKKILSLFVGRPVDLNPPTISHARRNNPFAIPVGPGDDPDLRIIAGPRSQYPKKLGKTPEQFKADIEAYHADLRAKHAASFRYTRKRAQSAGSKRYIWRTSNDGDACQICAKRRGKTFIWNKEPPHGHAGMLDCCPSGYCRCYAEPVFD